MNEHIMLRDIQVLSKEKFVLQSVSYDLKKKNGKWEKQQREVYDHGDAATVLLYNRARRTVVFVRQFRIATFLNKDPTGMLLETCAGLLEGEDPQSAIIREIKEETGCKVDKVQEIFSAYTSAGSLKEKLYFFIAEYNAEEEMPEVGGLEEEQEELDIVEMPFDEAVALLKKEKIIDAKTIILLQYALLNNLFD